MHRCCKKTWIKRLVLTAGIVFASVSMQGCWLAVAGAAGGAAGYQIHKHGYKVDSPIKKNTSTAKK